ncbi:putative ribonuclease H protein [Trifolium medium]|uniref:Putative ribonuclease H protein n=1 Tax=Trifolium medium TaxID=97028 RepID=A0A392TGG5_9FABA|nr:putative ribonuclease H protein [Trifolium medium]
MKSTTEHHQEQQIRWKPPPIDFLKCNIDAAVFATSKQDSMGACIRDEQRHFVAAKTMHKNDVMLPAEGEA